MAECWWTEKDRLLSICGRPKRSGGWLRSGWLAERGAVLRKASVAEKPVTDLPRRKKQRNARGCHDVIHADQFARMPRRINAAPLLRSLGAREKGDAQGGRIVGGGDTKCVEFFALNIAIDIFKTDFFGQKFRKWRRIQITKAARPEASRSIRRARAGGPV